MSRPPPVPFLCRTQSESHIKLRRMPSNVKSNCPLDERMRTASVRPHPSRLALVHEARSEGTLPISPNSIVIPKRCWRVVILGAGQVGKTSILSRFMHKRFPTERTSTSRPSADEMQRVDYSIGGVQMTAEILDTSGYHNFPAMQEVAIRQADAFILVFGVNSEESLERVKSIHQEIIRIKQYEQKCSIIPTVVVCNKMDLPAAECVVDVNYVQFLVKCDWENCGIVKASAKDDYGVKDCFKELLLGLKLRLPRNTVVKRVSRGLARIHSAPAGLRTNSVKFGSPKLLSKFRGQSLPVADDDECIIT
ncbi:GTP-binding protein Di-Ras1-like [Paramacrobiotus metropolitanus]|uniref:GTP-binding protein Di-Ras1-like n=1 Tax=Paramacrobiotus metropolitanus TaxID=2943436 RepID=UPI002445845D|nr:GTP-binding protein Di-Ras1-like [Paramacrobiotus metropolitanus]